MNIKNLVLIISLILTVSFTSAQLEFRTEDPINSYSDFNFNQNTITNLTVPDNPQGGEAITQRHLSSNYLQRSNGQLEGTLEANGEDIVGVGELELEGGTNITGSLNVSEGAQINENLKINQGGNSLIINGTESNHAYQEWYVNSSNPDQRSAWLGYGSGLNSYFTINNQYGDRIRLRGGDVEIQSGQLNLNSERITGLSNPVNNQDAATKNYVDINEQVLTESDVENYIFDTGDNSGNLGLNGREIVDNSGPITLGGGDVELTNGNLDIGSPSSSGAALDISGGINAEGIIQTQSGDNIEVDRNGDFVVQSDPGTSSGLKWDRSGTTDAAITMDSGENLNINTPSGLGSINLGTGTTNYLEIKESGGLKVENGNLDLNGNKLEGAQTVKAGSEMCIGQYCS